MNIENTILSNLIYNEDYARIVDTVIQAITSQIRNTYEMQKCNYNMDIWNGTLYGDFNKAGLRQHPPIKIRERHPQYMMFNMMLA